MTPLRFSIQCTRLCADINTFLVTVLIKQTVNFSLFHLNNSMVTMIFLWPSQFHAILIKSKPFFWNQPTNSSLRKRKVPSNYVILRDHFKKLNALTVMLVELTSCFDKTVIVYRSFNVRVEIKFSITQWKLTVESFPDIPL